MKLLTIVLTLLIAVASIPTRAAADSAANVLTVQRCTEGKAKVPAECGALRVYEDRAAQSGRTILIHFILLKAAHPNGHVIYVNLGGPDSELEDVPAITDGAAFKELMTLRGRYDVLFVDERGFGQSHGIGCDLNPAASPALYFRQIWPDALLTACRAKAVTHSGLDLYNTVAAVDDLDELRAALGYKQLIFDVGSYGTFTAFVYMRRHPEGVESAVLSGVAPPGISNLVREFSTGAQVSLDALAADCERDAACRSKYPHFREHFYAIVHRLEAGPMPVRMTDDATKRDVTVPLSREVFSDAIRHALYDPEGASYIPLVIERAYHNDTLPLGQFVDELTSGYASNNGAGAFLSYTCAEVIPFAGASSAASSKPSWFGDDRLLAQTHACSIWNVPALPASFNEPVHSAAPILMVSGMDDPATPWYEGKAELPYLSDARQMLIADAPHDAESPCVDRTIEAFIRADSWAGLDLTACHGNFKRPPFATTWPPQ